MGVAVRALPDTLRSRATAAFLLVALVPLLGFVLAIDRTLARVQAGSAERRIGLALEAAGRRIDELSSLARIRVATLVERDLPLASPKDDSDLASPGELRRMVDQITAVREAVGPEIDICVDMHGRYDTITGEQVAKRLEPLNVMWLEEPIPAITA